VVRIWKSGSFMAALRRVDEEAPLLFDDAAALTRHLEAESELPISGPSHAHGRAPRRYLLIESRNPHGSDDPRGYAALASQLKTAGHEVALFLVQNGVLPGCAAAPSSELREAIAAQVEVLADEGSLRERGIDTSGLVVGIKVAPLALVVERLAAGWKTLWH
jgi:sulfur relay (sulfurtransferase) DsrF/TusC family protein